MAKQFQDLIVGLERKKAETVKTFYVEQDKKNNLRQEIKLLTEELSVSRATQTENMNNESSKMYSWVHTGLRSQI